MLVLLAAGLLGLLLLNTVLAQGSFHLHALQVATKKLGDQQQGLQSEVDALQAPAALAAEAQRQGMVPAGPPVFLRLPDGTVLGLPTPAPTPTATPAPAVDVPDDAATAAPTPAASAAASAPAAKSPATPKASKPPRSPAPSQAAAPTTGAGR